MPATLHGVSIVMAMLNAPHLKSSHQMTHCETVAAQSLDIRLSNSREVNPFNLKSRLFPKRLRDI